LTITCGIDWAEAHHDVALVDEQGTVIARRRIRSGAEGFVALMDMIGEHGDDPADIPVAIETDKNLLVVALSGAGFPVYPINPRAVARYRERHGQAGGKSDSGDAAVLANILRTDRPMHRPLATISEHALAIKALARQHQEAIWALNQTASRLRSVLLEFYPHAVTTFTNLKRFAATAILAAAPTPEAAARLNRRRVVTILHRCGRRNDPTLVEKILAGLKAPVLRQHARVEAALGVTVVQLVAIINAMRTAVGALETELAREFDTHPMASTLQSAPGLGPILAARVLAEIGDDPSASPPQPGSERSPAPHRSPVHPAARATSKPARSATNASPTPATGGRFPCSPNLPAPAPTTTDAEPPASTTTLPYATSRTNSSGASGGAWPTTSPGTTPSPGPYQRPQNPLLLDNRLAWDVYLPMAGGGFGYTALVIDAYAGLIPGWECSTSKHTDFVEAAIRQAVPYRRRQGHPLGAGAIHHSDAGSQYTAVHFGQTLFLEGLTPSIGSVGDAYDNALAETTIGLYKTEGVRAGSPFRRGPIRTLADLEQITSLVQHPTAHASPRPRSTGRSRSRLPRCNRRRHPGGITHKLRGVLGFPS
jgi:transposase